MDRVTLASGAVLTCLVDGSSEFAPGVFPDLSEERRLALLADAGETAIRTQFNCFVLQDGPTVTLIDCGAGAAFGDKAGRAGALLAGMGIAAADVTRLVLTHLHSDHCGGGLHADGSPVFPRAEVVVQAAEARHWQGQDHLAARFLAAHEGRIRLIDGDVSVAPGIDAWSLPGHTPGHMGLWIGADCALVGDIVHGQHLQLPDPGIATRYDIDPATARHSRQSALALLAERGTVFGGGHLLDGLRRVTAAGAGYLRVGP